MAKKFNIVLEWRNFAKSVHTDKCPSAFLEPSIASAM